MTNSDFAYNERQALIQSTDPLEIKLKAAIAWLGPRWLLHPVNHLKRLPNAVIERRMTNVINNLQGFAQEVANMQRPCL